MIQRINTPQPNLDPDPIPVSTREEMAKLYKEILQLTEQALRKAIRLGGLLVQVQGPLKHAKIYENWVNGKMPFSARSARDYVTLYRNRELIENDAAADSMSIRAALKLIADTAKAATPPALEVCPLEIDVEAEDVKEDVEEEETRAADRVVLMVEAEATFVDQLVALIKAGKKAGHDIKYQQLGAFGSDVPMKAPFKQWLESSMTVITP